MFVAAYLVSNDFVALIYHPGQCESQEKPLVRCKVVNCLLVKVLPGFFECFVSHDDSAYIGYVFALGEFTVNMKIVNRNILIELFNDHFGFTVEFYAVLFSPPVI